MVSRLGCFAGYLLDSFIFVVINYEGFYYLFIKKCRDGLFEDRFSDLVILLRI